MFGVDCKKLLRIECFNLRLHHRPNPRRFLQFRPMKSFTSARAGRDNPDDYQQLLAWLGPDEATATEKYFALRRSLVKIFEVRSCPDAEDLADEVIDRVARKAAEVRDGYTGEPGAYFYGVARNVYREYLRRPRTAELPPQLSIDDASDDEKEAALQCLDKCLAELSEENRELISAYYAFADGEKANVRRGLAERYDITMNLLRIRAYRIRTALSQCVSGCIAQNG